MFSIKNTHGLLMCHLKKYYLLKNLQNGDYNKPIPAQFMEHLNHGVSAGLPVSEAPKTLQWVNCQMLLCKKCNNHQTVKIKQLASFTPREEVRLNKIKSLFKLRCDV